MIKGGYYLKARCIQNSSISTAPPHIREMWDWILKEANYKDNNVCKRGQCIRTYSDIQEGLKWYVGYRKMTYKKHQCENSLKWLRKAEMVTTTKTTRGIVITVCNYDEYQNPENYECYTKDETKATMLLQCTDTINKKEKKDKKEKNKNIYVDEIFKSYPSRCPLSNRATGKCAKNKSQILKLLDKKTKDEIIDIQNLYINDCNKSKTYYKSYSTFLNNFPERDQFMQLDLFGGEKEKYVYNPN